MCEHTLPTESETRDIYAAFALQGILARYRDGYDNFSEPEAAASYAFRFADAMMDERKRRNIGGVPVKSE